MRRRDPSCGNAAIDTGRAYATPGNAKIAAEQGNINMRRGSHT
jgi:hypothetical protein